MKTTKKPVFTALKDGKPVRSKIDKLAAFVALSPAYLSRFVAVATFPGTDKLRAITFATDEGYVDTVIEAVEKKWPGTPKKVKTGVAKKALPTKKESPKTHKTYTVVRQDWEESEEGWGIRPDGYTLHLTVEDRDKFVAEFWAEEKKRNPSGQTPHVYTRESRRARPVTVDAETYAKLNTPEAKKRHGLRVWK